MYEQLLWGLVAANVCSLASVAALLTKRRSNASLEERLEARLRNMRLERRPEPAPPSKPAASVRQVNPAALSTWKIPEQVPYTGLSIESMNAEVEWLKARGAELRKELGRLNSLSVEEFSSPARIREFAADTLVGAIEITDALARGLLTISEMQVMGSIPENEPVTAATRPLPEPERARNPESVGRRSPSSESEIVRFPKKHRSDINAPKPGLIGTD